MWRRVWEWGWLSGRGVRHVSRRNLHFILKSFYRSLPDRFKAFIFFVIPRLTFIPPLAPFLNFFLLLPFAAADLSTLARGGGGAAVAV